MTVKNSEGENQKPIVVLSCSAEFTAEVQGKLIFLSIVNIFLSITAVLGNTLILVALHKETSLHPPSKLLYRNLAVTDFCVGTIAEPLHVAYWISVVTGKWDICYLAHLMVTLAAYTFCGVSLLTLTAISVDRLLALLLGLRYRQVVTVKKTYIAILAFWIVSVVGVPASTAIREYVHYIGTALCLAITIVAHSKIFFRLRHNQIHRIHPLQGESQAIQMNTARYRKAVYSALWVQAALVVCYLPLIIAIALIHQRGMHLSSYLAWQFTSTLVYINSSLNSFIYCWKIREVKLAVKETLKRLVR